MAVTRNADAVAPVRSSGPLSIWLTRHASTSLGALGRLARHPFSSAMIVLVIAVTLALPRLYPPSEALLEIFDPPHDELTVM